MIEGDAVLTSTVNSFGSLVISEGEEIRLNEDIVVEDLRERAVKVGTFKNMFVVEECCAICFRYIADV